jgi:uncharacterized protein
MSANGRFVWFDLMTSDLQGAKTFFGDLIGWKLKSFGGDYDMWTASDGQEIGGLMKLPDEARAAGAPPHWIGYVQTSDVDATARRAQQLGGKVLVPGTDIPNVGRFAVLSDPQGAAFAVYANTTGQEWSPNPEALGHVGWSELNTTDWKSGWAFYSELFDWKTVDTMDMGEFGAYHMFGPSKEQMIGGMSDAANMMKAPAHWLHYFNVKSVDDAAKQVEQKGGKVLNGPMDVPGGSRIVQCMDPQGGFFALVSSAGGK